MAKYHGKIVFASQTEKTPGVWVDEITEHECSGDVLRMVKNIQTSGNLNDDISINNQISIVMDAFINANLFAARYIEFMGAKWKITSVEVQYPRLILTIGGVWNGEPH